jgi:Tol biopolymer transport system component
VAVVAPGELSTSGRVFVVGVDDASVREVKTGPRGERTWSATGAVAISHPRGIYVWSRRAGRRLALAATHRVTYTDPDWSPDGRRIVALRTDLKTRLETIVTATANGRDRRIVVRGPAPGCQLGPPAWSPSGTRIAFTALCLDPRSAANALFTVRTNGEGLRTVFEADPLIPKSGSFVAGMGPDVSWQPLTG